MSSWKFRTKVRYYIKYNKQVTHNLPNRIGHLFQSKVYELINISRSDLVIRSTCRLKGFVDILTILKLIAYDCTISPDVVYKLLDSLKKYLKDYDITYNVALLYETNN